MIKSNALPERWWETCACVSRVFSKRDGISLNDTINMLDAYHEQGISCIEIFSPYHGGDQYGGLDPINYYIIDPAIGIMHDFLKLVDKSHQLGIAVIIFINVGYAAMNNGDFIKAQDDMRRGIDSKETRYFIWGDGETKHKGSLSSQFGQKSEGYWQYSSHGNKYYWVKWRGTKNDVALPQFNFASREWQTECKNIIRFWMDTGIDGVIIDAPYSYTNCDFATHNTCITDIINEYPNKYTQPEGGGAAGEDFSRWITDAHYNSLQDYSIYEGWYKTSTIEDVIFSGDVALLEKKFRRWRDKIAMLGGTTYLGIIWNSSLSPEQRLLEFVTIVTVGAMLHDDNKLMFSDLPSDIRKKAADMFKLCSSSPALRLNGQREVIICGDGIYAFKRYNNFKNSAVVAMNFSEKTRDLVLDMPTHRLTGSLTSDGLPLPLSGAATPGPLKIRLEPYGYAILILN